jgi:O-antigen/teichoic acid export membrane protein
MIADKRAESSLGRRVLGGVFLLVVALVAGGAIRWLALPFIVHAVSPAVYGTYATLWVLFPLLRGLSDLGLGTAAMRFAPEASDDVERRSLFATMLSARATLALLLTLAMCFVHRPLARWLTGDESDGPALLVLALALPMSALCDGLMDELRTRDKIPQVAALVVLRAVLVQGLTLLFVVGLGFGLSGLVWPQPIMDVVVFVVAVALCWHFVRARPKVPDLFRLLAFGWPLGALQLLVVLRGLDHPMIARLSSLEDVAAYELAQRLVGPIGLFNIALAGVLEPVVYARSQSETTSATIALFLRGYVGIFAGVALFLSILAPELVSLFAPRAYHGAIQVLPLLAFGELLNGIRRAAGIGADLAKRTRVWAVASLVTLFVGLSMTWILVPHIGPAGAALGWILGTVLATLILYRVSREVSGITLPIGRSLAFVLAAALIGTCATWQDWSLPVRLLVLAGCSAACWVGMGVRLRELRTLR